MTDSDALKRRAADRAVILVKDGMRLGLGTGSTARHFVQLVGDRVREGLKVTCVPTSEQTRQQAAALGIPLATLDELSELDLTVDGTDEIDGALNLIKGGGGAHLREKMVAAASRSMVVIADSTKRVQQLGAFPLAHRGRSLWRRCDAPKDRAGGKIRRMRGSADASSKLGRTSFHHG